MYIPDADSFLIIDSIKEYSGQSALEIGTGTGIISKFLLKNFKYVVSTDIDYNSLLYCKKQNNSKINFICCDATTAISSKFYSFFNIKSWKIWTYYFNCFIFI